MTKAELARRMPWRFTVIQQAAKRSRNISRTCGILTFLGSYSAAGPAIVCLPLYSGYAPYCPAPMKRLTRVAANLAINLAVRREDAPASRLQR
jgi:hypothetical protein